METIRLTIKPQSAFKTPLQSDTIFGQFCWYYKYIYGEKKLLEILDNFHNQPTIIFSDGFLSGYLPKPIVKPMLSKVFNEIVKDFSNNLEIKYKLMKQFKKLEFIDEETFLLFLEDRITSSSILKYYIEILNNKDDKDITDYNFSIKKHTVLKNSVNRISNTTTEGLYQSTELYFGDDINFDIYIKYLDDRIKLFEIEEVFEVIGKVGFGADKSIGKGRFKIDSVSTDFELMKFLKPYDGANGFINISSGLYMDEKIILNYGATFTKFGRHGGDKAVCGMPFKSPLILYRPGSTFFKKEDSDFYGASTSEIFYDKNDIHNGFMIPIFCKLEHKDES
ncbi:type III-A CRISPR-associated RAMP protein Csm4 [Deferribacter abyssi]|uniref:type III-A CRISPR-associated RAMP protein Csm4 n=1 Tax=Deferribacter abyssi TaxID=213806 RepID=UPI003C2322B3